MAGVGSRNPLLSMTRTWNVCVPRLTAVYVSGLAHEVKYPASRRHSNPATTPLSVPVNRSVIVLEVVLPPFAIDLPRPSTADGTGVSGGASTVHVRRAGVGSALLDVSMARTSTVWRPSARPGYVHGLVHALKPAPSSRHSNRATPRSSVPVNVNVTDLDSVVAWSGTAAPPSSVAEVILVSGGASTVQMWRAGVGST